MIDLYGQLNHCVLSLVFATRGGLFRMFACDLVTTLATVCGNGGSLRLSRRHSGGAASANGRLAATEGRATLKVKSARDSQNVDFWRFWDFLARASHLGTAVPGDSPES